MTPIKQRNDTIRIERLTDILLRKRLWIATILFLATLGLMGPLAEMGIEMDNRTERFAPKGDLGFKHLAEMQAEFGRDDVFTALVQGDVYSQVFLDRLKQLHDDLEALDKTEKQAASLWSVPLIIEREQHRQAMTLQYAMDRRLI